MIAKLGRAGKSAYDYVKPIAQDIARESFQVLKSAALAEGEKLVRKGATKLQQEALKRLAEASNSAGNRIDNINLSGSGLAPGSNVTQVSIETKNASGLKLQPGMSRFGLDKYSIQQGEGFKDRLNGISKGVQDSVPDLTRAGISLAKDYAIGRMSGPARLSGRGVSVKLPKTRLKVTKSSACVSCAPKRARTELQ